jgi:hypothetical protein
MGRLQPCVISGLCREVDGSCVLLGYYAASSGNFLPTFREPKYSRKTCPKAAQISLGMTFNYMLLFQQDQRANPGNPPNDHLVSEVRDHWIGKYFHLAFKLAMDWVIQRTEIWILITCVSASVVLRSVPFIASLSSAAVSVNAGFLSDKFAAFGDTIKGTIPVAPSCDLDFFTPTRCQLETSSGCSYDVLKIYSNI